SHNWLYLEMAYFNLVVVIVVVVVASSVTGQPIIFNENLRVSPVVFMAAPGASISSPPLGVSAATAARVKRSSYYGPSPIWVNTYAMTDYHGNFKWGVKHNVGHVHH
ncbi:unnamed protein product, partial [Meganyctiphanes norvegica]